MAAGQGDFYGDAVAPCAAAAAAAGNKTTADEGEADGDDDGDIVRFGGRRAGCCKVTLDSRRGSAETLARTVLMVNGLRCPSQRPD